MADYRRNKELYTTVTIRLKNQDDKQLIDWLQSQKSMNACIRELIEKAINNDPASKERSYEISGKIICTLTDNKEEKGKC